MVTLISAFRSLGTGISSVFRSGFSKITNLFHRIFSRSTPQTPPTNLQGRVTTDGQESPLLPKFTNGNPPAGAAAQVVQSGSAAKSAKPAEATPPKTKITLSPASITKSSAAAVAISKSSGAGSALVTHCPPFRVVDQPKDGNCFFHSLRAGLKHLKHSERSKTHKELRQDMVRLIREKNFSLGATIYQEIIDLQSKLSDDFENYKIAENFAKESGQQISRQALIQSILSRIPRYIRTFVEIGGISVTSPPKTVHEAYEMLISGLEVLSCLALDDSFNDKKFAPVIQSYLGTISEPSCQVNILSAEPLANKLNVAIVLHQNSQDYRELARVGPERGQEVHLVQAGSHFDLLIPN